MAKDRLRRSGRDELTNSTPAEMVARLPLPPDPHGGPRSLHGWGTAHSAPDTRTGVHTCALPPEARPPTGRAVRSEGAEAGSGRPGKGVPRPSALAAALPRPWAPTLDPGPSLPPPPSWAELGRGWSQPEKAPVPNQAQGAAFLSCPQPGAGSTPEEKDAGPWPSPPSPCTDPLTRSWWGRLPALSPLFPAVSWSRLTAVGGRVCPGLPVATGPHGRLCVPHKCPGFGLWDPLRPVCPCTWSTAGQRPEEQGGSSVLCGAQAVILAVLRDCSCPPGEPVPRCPGPQRDPG